MGKHPLCSYWWLRSPNYNNTNNAYNINSSGAYDWNNTNNNNGVRAD